MKFFQSAIWPMAAAALAAALGAGQADRPRPAPAPPEQGKPWTAPETKLPRFLVSATADLLAQGVADPRGCEYREARLAPPGRWRPAGAPPQVRVFVLPPVVGDDRRFAVDWEGQVRQVDEIGPAADLDSDIRERAEAASKKPREDAAIRREALLQRGQAGEASPPLPFSPMQVCLLLRIGRADLAETLFAAATPWEPGGDGPDLTDYGFNYLTLANGWSSSLYDAGVAAHGRGDDAVALDTFRRVAAFRDAATARAEAMGFPRQTVPGVRGDRRLSYFPALDQLDELLADQRRRAAEPPRGPIPGRDADPAARVAALILNLDQIAEHQMSSPGAANPGGSPLVDELVAMGDAAVEPLLKALVDDNRMTRSITHGRGLFSEGGLVSPTSEAIAPALGRLMKTAVPGVTSEMQYRPGPAARRALADVYRKFWRANKDIPLAERHYRTLADDTAADRWLSAAGALTFPASSLMGDPRNHRFVRPGQPAGPPLGESLRQGRDPSITALMVRRIGDLARRAEVTSDPLPACQMAATLATWDPAAGAPHLREAMDRARAEFDKPRGQGQLRPYAQFIARTTLDRARSGDRAALDEYAAWIASTNPGALEYVQLVALEPMWLERDHPSIAEAARRMFSDPASPWRKPSDRGRKRMPLGGESLESSPMIRAPAFREAVLADLADTSPAGTLTRKADQPNGISYELENRQGSGGFSGASMTDLDELPVGEVRPVRACDWLAHRLASLDGPPRFEIYWPEPRRDEAIAALSAFLRRYGDHYEAAGPADRSNPFESLARLSFPRLDRPATPADVEAGRALFSLEGMGDEVRVVPLPEYPLAAAWTTLEDTPLTFQTQTPDGESRTRHDFDRSGRVWQAEEVRVGDHWERYFGFVGPHTAGRAPAAEIRFLPYLQRFSATPPPEGPLGVRLDLADRPEDGFRPGAPVVVVAHLQNITGLDQEAPTEFVRAGTDGQPELREGVSLQLWFTPPAPDGLVNSSQAQATEEEITPRRDARFTPADGRRTLGPAELFEAFRLGLGDWFDLSRPGQYRLQLSLGGEPGHCYFQVNP